MRIRYWLTSSRDVSRRAAIAACISGIVASTMLNWRIWPPITSDQTTETLSTVAPAKLSSCFMAGILDHWYVTCVLHG